MAKDIAELQEQAERILDMAKAKGAQSNYFFTTSFHRYQMQIQILSGLENAIEEYGTMISKVNVKGGENIVTNPAIAEYTKTAAVANATASILLKILNNIPDQTEEKDALSEFLKDG